MFSIAITNRLRTLWALALILPTLSWGQGTESTMTAKFSPGTNTRYEFEGLVHISTEHAPGVRIKGQADCSYQVRAVLKLDFNTTTADGTLGGRISFQGIEAQVPECATASKDGVTNAVKELETNGAGFQIYPAGDVRLTKSDEPDQPEIVAILRKAAWDLLQPRLANAALAPGSPWTRSRRYLFWPDTFVAGLDVAATSMHYARDLEIGTRTLALLEYKQVFSPAEMPAYVEARTHANDFTGTTMVTGHSSVSLLWSRTDQRVMYLRRQRTIDNRLTLKYDPTEQASNVARFLLQEESTLRWLPVANAEAWLAELHRYESSAGETSPHPAADRKQEEVEHRELSDLVNRVPRGFERWNKTFCSGPYCFELSVALPVGTRVADSSGMTVLLLGGSGDRTVMVSVGPMFDLQCTCLTDQELLQQQTERFVGNNLWFGRGTGQAVNFSSVSVHDRPAGFSDFTSKSRDLKGIRGQLVMLIGPYDRLVPVACAHNEDQPDLDSVCQTVTQSVIIE